MGQQARPQIETPDKPHVSLYRPLLESSRDSGCEVIVALRHPEVDSFQGRILSVNEADFTLFHSGVAGGVLWTFSLADVAYCGQLVALPQFDSDVTEEPNLASVDDTAVESDHPEQKLAPKKEGPRSKRKK